MPDTREKFGSREWYEKQNKTQKKKKKVGGGGEEPAEREIRESSVLTLGLSYFYFSLSFLHDVDDGGILSIVCCVVLSFFCLFFFVFFLNPIHQSHLPLRLVVFFCFLMISFDVTWENTALHAIRTRKRYIVYSSNSRRFLSRSSYYNVFLSSSFREWLKGHFPLGQQLSRLKRVISPPPPSL